MRAVSDKYIAGFLDSDGSIWVSKEGKLWVEFFQKTSNDGVIYLIHEVLKKGYLGSKKGKRRGTVTYATRLAIQGQAAVDTLCRLKPYLVTKRVKANRILSELGFTERVGTDSIPVFPSRSWLAGYFDGDGCIYAGVSKKGGTASVKVSIDTNAQETAGIELVQKMFGGVIDSRGNGNQVRWTLHMDAPKAIKFLSYIAPRLNNKREQAYFVLKCAEMGHFRDGKVISDALKVMKTHPHRLNELASEVDISDYAKQVKNLNRDNGTSYTYCVNDTCSKCGSTKVYALNLCNKCWQRQRYHSRMKRQSEQHICL